MKTNKIIAFALLIMSLIFTSCTKEECKETYEGTTYTANYAPMSSLRTVSVNPAKAITSYGKIFIKGNYIFLNEVDKGFHIIDNSNPAAPNKIAFVSVPGNLDLIGKGNYLIADSYIDLLTFDISNPNNIQLVNRKENALPYRIYNYGFTDDSARGIIVNFTKKIETKEMNCAFGSNRFFRFDAAKIFVGNGASPSTPIPSSNNENGQAGSLSRFALVNNYLYVANRYNLTPIDISNPLMPITKTSVYTGEQETIYPFNDNLFIGTPNGLNIYSLTNPEVPTYKSTFRHWRGCDPVVVENNIAYVTVRNNGRCGGNINELDIINVSNISNPILLKKYDMKNPYGLGIYNNKLGICDGTAGFKLFNATDYNNLNQTGTINVDKSYDVIMNDQIAILIASDGMYQYNISSTTPQFLSKIAITN
jgi:hypothetical protein